MWCFFIKPERVNHGIRKEYKMNLDGKKGLIHNAWFRVIFTWLWMLVIGILLIPTISAI